MNVYWKKSISRLVSLAMDMEIDTYLGPYT
jgi:hypothetical protein